MEVEKMTDDELRFQHIQARCNLDYSPTVEDYKHEKACMREVYIEMKKRGVAIPSRL